MRSRPPRRRPICTSGTVRSPTSEWLWRRSKKRLTCARAAYSSCQGRAPLVGTASTGSRAERGSVVDIDEQVNDRRRPGRLVSALRGPRLVIAERPTRRDHLHGAWWPYSTEIDVELPPLLAAVAARLGTVFGVMLNRDEWATTPLDATPGRAGKPKISWYGLSESNLVVLQCSDYRRFALLLLSPGTPEEIALTATLMASAPGNGLTTDETLTRAREQANAARRR
ncbi:MAG TPA: DUF5994 family protein [Jatrophihabitans sp.]|nr:DUF5994 family protein [Jatrophihabitans sp.]